MSLPQITADAKAQMAKAVDFLKSELRGIRTGRASTALVDGIKVDVESYGSTMGMKELGTVAVAEGNIIVIKPFDPSVLKDIQRAIEKADIGINPQNDGKMIRLPVPPLSGERRKQLVQQVGKLAEQQKVAVRNVRRDANKAIDTAAKKDKIITEDEGERGQDEIQKLTDQHIKEIDAAAEEKSKDVMEG